MIGLRPTVRSRRATLKWRWPLSLIASLTVAALAHPLGNFTINHFTHLEVGAARLTLRYVVEMAEIPTFQELQVIDADRHDSPSEAELNAYAERMAPQYRNGLLLTLDGARVELQVISQTASIRAGDGGLPTLRVVCDVAGAVPPSISGTAHRLRFEDHNHGARIGWHEIVATSAAGVTIFNSSAFGNAITDELKAYPADLLTAPLNERVAELSFTPGAVPSSVKALLTRDGRPAVTTRDRFAELIAAPELTPAVALLGLLLAFGLGGLHALSPGHGKTVVGAYLVGSRGTARHAAFLGLTVTITHTIGVFALGLVTLFASQYIVPERLFPILTFISGAIVLAIGLSLFVRRLRAALGSEARAHASSHHDHDHTHEAHDHSPDGHDEAPSGTHSHGGRAHSHLPPGVDGSPVTWRHLLALGISGGLLPCPSALVVLLSSIALHRVGFGLVLIVAFSLGLASALTGVGLAFVYAGRLMKRPMESSRLVRVLPVVSAFVITCAGAVICYEALKQAGLDLVALLSHSEEQMSVLSNASILVLGLIFGLRHAVEADHLAAVSAIVSERKSLLSSWLVGGLWGVGHTISLLIAGVAVILLHIKISDRVAMGLEFGVGIMLIGLGANAIYKLARGGQLHLHAHQHGGHTHLHPHIHTSAPEPEERTRHGFRARPLFVGMAHGLAGSAALMLLLVPAIPSPPLAFAYIVVFGIGSIGGMMLMSSLVALPVHLTATRFTRVNFAVRALAGLFSLGFGLFMVYEKGFAGGLLR